MTAEKKVFVRKATGLVREIGFVTAVLVVICNVVGLGWQKRAFQFTGPAPVPETTYVLGLAPITMSFILVGIVVLFTVFVFAILGAAMPRSGGGYIWISRLIHPFVGFVGSMVEYWSIAVSFGLIGTAVFEAVLIYGSVGGVSPDLMAFMGQPLFLFLGGIFFVVLFAVIACLGVALAGRLLQIMFWIPLAITVLLYGALMAATPATMEAGLMAITGHDATYYTKIALDQGMATAFTGSYWDAHNVAVLGSYWAYIGFAASTFVAGEIKEASKTLPRTLFLANGFIILLYITMSYLAVRACMMVGQVGDWTFFNAYAYLSYAGERPPEIPKAWMPVVAAFSAKGMGWDWLLALIPIFAAFWVANDIPPFILTASRLLFAMSFDRVVPESLAAVNERFHSPINAIIATMLVAFIGNAAESDIFPAFLGADHVLSRYINSGSGVAATDIWDTMFFLLAAIAGLFFVFRKKGKEIYERSAYKPRSIGVVAVIALIAVVGNIWLSYAEFSAAAMLYPIETWLLTLYVIIVGALVYLYYKYAVGKRAGVDYTTVYAEVPPE